MIAEKLNYLIALTDASNVQISKALNVDASLVSKWRKGTRSPAHNLEVLIGLAEYFAGRIRTEYQRSSLRDVLNEPSPLPQNTHKTKEIIFAWFKDNAPLPQNALLQRTGAKGGLAAARPFGNFFDGTKASDRKARKKALASFAELIETGKDRVTLFFYCDEPAEWIRITTDCLTELSSTNPAMFEQIEEARILVPNDILKEETQDLIDVMLPFLKNSPVRVSRLPRPRHDIFQHMVMAVQNAGAVVSYGIIGCSPPVIFHANAAHASAIANRLNALFNEGSLLMDYLGDIDLWEAHGMIGHMADVREDLIAFGNSLCIFTIPPSILDEILNLFEMTHSEKREEIKKTYGERFENFLRHNRFICGMPLYSPPEVESGAVIVPHLPRFVHNQTTFTPRRYLEVLKHIERLATDYENFTLQICDELEHDRSLIVQNKRVLYVTQNEPKAFTFTSDRAGVVSSYYHTLLKRYQSLSGEQKSAERNLGLLRAHIRMLEEHLKQSGS